MLALSAFTALHEMSLGRARTAEWRTLTDTIVIVQALCGLGKLDAGVHMSDIELALDSMGDALQSPSGTMGLQGAPLAAASKVVAAFDDALGRLAAKTIDIAVADVVWRVNQTKARSSGSPLDPGG
jgi:hypothetical protein